VRGEEQWRGRLLREVRYQAGTGGLITVRIKRKYLLLLLVLIVAVAVNVALPGFNASADVGRLCSHTSSPSFSFGGSRQSGSGWGGISGPLNLLMILSLFRSPWLWIILVAVAYIAYRSYLQNQGQAGPLGPATGYQGPPIHPANTLGSLKEKDPRFSEEKFIARVNNMYIQLQEAWTKKHWQTIRPFETDELFNMHAKQLQEYIDKHTTNVVEDIAILATTITGYQNDGVNDIIDVVLKVRIKDYVSDDQTGKVIENDPHEQVYMTYFWKRIRKQGLTTRVDDKITTATQCPNCGANISINASGECEYCGSVISRGDYDWVLSSIELIEQA